MLCLSFIKGAKYIKMAIFKQLVINTVTASYNLLHNAVINYTLIKNISLKSNEAINDVMIDWKQAAAFKKGTYQIFIIYEGDVIGYNAISLK